MMLRLIVSLLCLLPVSAWAEYLPIGVNQGSTTSGQIGVLSQCAVTTSEPSYTTGQTFPCSVTTSGEMRVRIVSSAVGSPSDDDDGTIAAGATSLSKVLVENYAYNSDSGTTAWTRWSHQTADYDSGAGTENLSMIGLALPGSGGPVAGGTSTNPIRTDPTGSTAQPAAQSGTWTVQPGNTANTTAWLVKTGDPCSQTNKISVPISQVTSTELLTGTASNRTYVCSIVVSQPSSSTQTFSLVSGTGTVCGTGTAAMIGGSTAANGVQNAFSHGGGSGFVAKSTADAANVCLLQSGTDRIAGVLTYVVAAN